LRGNLRRGLIFLSGDRPDLALPYLEKAVSEDPRDPKAVSCLASCLASTGKRLDEALELARLALSADPDVPRYHAVVAQVLSRLGRFDEALEEGLEVLRLAPEEPDAYRDVSYLYLKTDRSVEALEAAERGLEKDPENTDLLLNRSLALFRMERFAECRQVLEEVLCLDPTNANAHNNVACLAQRMEGDLEQAERQFLEALRFDPMNEAASKNLLRIPYHRWARAVKERFGPCWTRIHLVALAALLVLTLSGMRVPWWAWICWLYGLIGFSMELGFEGVWESYGSLETVLHPGRRKGASPAEARSDRMLAALYGCVALAWGVGIATRLPILIHGGPVLALFLVFAPASPRWFRRPLASIPRILLLASILGILVLACETGGGALHLFWQVVIVLLPAVLLTGTATIRRTPASGLTFRNCLVLTGSVLPIDAFWILQGNRVGPKGMPLWVLGCTLGLCLVISSIFLRSRGKRLREGLGKGGDRDRRESRSADPGPE
jgi:tetratricopeptide (TPR) repeat protein